MSPLAAACLSLLEAEAEMPALATVSISRVLYCTGYDGGPDPVPVTTIEAALGELMQAGKVERVWRRGLPHYRVIRPGPETEANA